MSDDGIEIDHAAVAASVAQVDAWLNSWIDTVDMELPGRGQSLGRDIIGTVASGMQKRASQDQTDAEGTPWQPNAEPYATRKEKLYGWVLANYRTGQTFSLVNLIGTSSATKDEVTMRGGVDSPPASSVSPTGFLSDADKKVSGRDKLQWAHEASKTRPARPGYALDDDIVEAVVEACENSVSAHVVKTNAGGGGP
jgi:hypothetical protein